MNTTHFGSDAPKTRQLSSRDDATTVESLQLLKVPATLIMDSQIFHSRLLVLNGVQTSTKACLATVESHEADDFDIADNLNFHHVHQPT